MRVLLSLCALLLASPVWAATVGLYGVLVDTNSVVVFPTNFFAANATALSSVVVTNAITKLNNLTATNQTFAVGTTGSDFNIVSATSTHTFNLPSASAANRGALLSADWTTFNNKQGALVNSAGLAAALSDESGTGAAVFAGSPSLTGSPLLTDPLANSLVVTNFMRSGTTNISTGAANFSANGPGTVIWTNSASTTVTLLNVPTSTSQAQVFSFSTKGNGAATNGFVSATHTIVWRTAQITTPANGIWVDYDFMQHGTLIFAYAFDGQTFTTGAGVTNISNVVSANLAAGASITFTTNANGQISIAASGGGSGDFVGPGSATDNAIVRFDTTTGKLGQNSLITIDDIGALIVPDGVRQTFNPNGTNPGLNVGQQAGDPSAPTNGDVWYDSTGNLLRARINGASISLGAGAGTGDVVGPASATDNAFARYDTTTGKLIQNSVVVATDAGAITVGDGAQATLTLDYNLSGSTDPLIRFGDAYATNNFVLQGPNGSAAAPTYSYAGSTNSGAYMAGNNWRVSISGTDRLNLDATSLDLQSTAGELRIGSAVFIKREAPDVWQVGADTGTPAAQTFHGPDGSGTDRPGGDVLWGAGRSTGSGTGGSLLFQTSPSGASSSSLNTLTTRLTINGAGDVIVAAGSTFSLPNAAAPVTDATAEIALDTTITDHQPLFQYYSGTGEMLIPAFPRADLPTTDNFVLVYDAVGDKFTFEAQGGGGGATAWNDIGDATADGSIALAGFETDFTSSIDAAGEAAWTMTMTDADVANATSAFDIKFNDGADADALYMQMIGDADGTPTTDYSFSQTKMSLGAGVQLSLSGNSAASTPIETLTGTWFTGGSASTTKPHFLIEPTGTTSAAWSTAGTGLGVNAASGFGGTLQDLQLNGVSKSKVDIAGNTTLAGGATLFFGGRGAFTYTATGAARLANDAANGFTSLLLGVNDSSPDATVTVQAASGVGTDISGGAISVAGGARTGTGSGGNVRIQTTPSATSTGTGAGTLTDRYIAVAKGKVLTDASAVSLFEVALPTLKMTGGRIVATVTCTDGTDMQSFSQTIELSAVNKGGVYTKSITANTGEKSVTGGSTLTTSWTLLDGTDKVTVQLNADTSLTPSANSFLCYYSVFNNSEQAITIIP